MKGPAGAVKLIDSYIEIDMPPKPTRSVLLQIISDEGWAIEENPDELAERWHKAFVLRLQKRAASEAEQSIISCFDFNSANESYVQGSCYVEPGDTVEASNAKRRRANSVHYRRAFERLTDTQFEILCSRIIGFWKVEEEFYTRASADQGIDFFGRMPMGELIHPSAIGPGAEKQMKVWLVGQAKNYSASQVSTKDIRELVGSVNLARSKAYAGSIDPLAKLQMRTCDPVFFLFFTTGSISRDARDLLSKAGVVAMDGTQLSVFLADNGAGLDADGQFSEPVFLEWAFPPA